MKKEVTRQAKLQRLTRSIGSFNKSENLKKVLEDVVTSSFKKVCQNSGSFCPWGMPGPPGRAGPKGDKGNQGRRGRKGPQGMMGQPGRSGKQGIMGPTGIRGEKGIKGDTGAPGIPGMKGERGIMGQTGMKGEKGIKGDTGAPGIPGMKGERGIMGPKGIRGQKGIKGDTATPGIPGMKGERGIMGPKGIRGQKGIKGDTGAPGIKGMKGEPGESISVPKITVYTSQVNVNESITVSLMCSASGNPAPQITWSGENGVSHVPSSRTKVTAEGLMQIDNARFEDAEKYKCVARNVLGREEAVATLVARSKNVIKQCSFW